MPYDKSFYRKYLGYLRELVVRQNHDHVFRLFASLVLPETPRVVDLGCGLGEYARYDPYHSEYAGIDLNDAGEVPNFVQADYRGLDFAHLLPFSPNAFISLFSIEIFMPAEEKYAFYERIFRAFPSIWHGLAGGFFYELRRDQEMVSETGGIVSYQTIEDPAQHISELFTELRIHMRTPSEMFGGDVVEVWKIFARK